MSTSLKILTPLLALLTLSGCTPPPESSAAKKPAQEATLLQSQTQALEKAKQLQQVVQSAASAQQATIDQQTH